jgi:2-amino-4-hydroxy-6-hydroxymethyldihydropteridine diphosphokinase
MERDGGRRGADRMIEAYIALGSNLGDRLENLSAALSAIDGLSETHVVAVSHVYESEPWGVADQAPFANAVALVETRLQADQLLNLLKDIEEQLGRTEGERNGPRPMDLDILLYGDEEWRSEELTIPHPRMAERDFVITPLLELAPEGVSWPDGQPITDAEVRVGRVIGELGAVPGFEDRTIVRSRPLRQGPPPGAEPDLGPEDFKDGSFASSDFRFVTQPEPIRSRTGEEWVPLGMAERDPSPAAFELLFFEAVLKDADIPCEFYPHRPNEGSYGPYWTPGRIDLYVPRSKLQEARRLLAEAQAAPPDWSGSQDE